MMSHKSPSLQNFEILCDSHSPRIRHSEDSQEPAPLQSQPLCHISVSQSQNRQPIQGPTSTGIRELDQFSHNPHWGVIKKNRREKQAGCRLTRPSITPNTFEVPSTIIESEPQTQSVPTDHRTPDNAQHILQLPVDRYSSHPLSIAASDIPPLEEQLAKHRSGLFEWILAVRIPSDSSESQRDSSGINDPKAARKVYFGCNLLPEPLPGANGTLNLTRPAESYLLLVTSLKETKDVLEVFCDPVNDSGMALPEANSSHSTPAKVLDSGLLPEVNENTPTSTLCTLGDDSFMESVAAGSPENAITRIEDSFEALDILEDQLEAFDKVARFNKFIPTEKPPSTREPTGRYTLGTSSPSVRFTTPQPQRTFAQSGSASVRVKSATEPRRTALRKVTSMNLDPHKFRAEDKNAFQSSPTSIVKGNNNLSQQRLVTKSTKQTPTFELPGEALARQLKEKNEARIASQRATQPTAASLRRARSAKLPTRPTFELPGEAISRRKREEHQAQLRTQEEEERKRREFKARPVPSHGIPATVPRETIASRARQNKSILAENSARLHTHTKPPWGSVGSHSRAALSTTINQSQPRGRGLRMEEPPFLDISRATSTSTASVSGKRSSLSMEDVQMQKLRGHEIYQRDNSWTENRMREKYEREAQAKFAREEAAERSRQKSREWAAKQARKRLTVGPVPDVTA
ncbi:hypothetical protein GGS24DRAFT_343331 [Hypoxylon argillaceum]|nr:hypothetical protein GGS24DRAFT_343331 [Hypoxylon argillaceum]